MFSSTAFHHSLRSEIDIDAPPSAVWATLTDLSSYQDWNPFIIDANGEPNVGEQLVMTIQPVGSRPSTFKPRLTVVEPRRRLEWLGRIGPPRLFEGRHRFELQELDGGNRTRLIHGEDFDGVLVPLLKRLLDRSTGPGFEAMNEALKQRTERQVADQDAAWDAK